MHCFWDFAYICKSLILTVVVGHNGKQYPLFLGVFWFSGYFPYLCNAGRPFNCEKKL